MTRLSDKTVAEMIAYSEMTVVDDKPYFTIGEDTYTFKKSSIMCACGCKKKYRITPTAHMFLNAHLNTVPVVSVN